jgi:energy-converting hydrogenase Eha subunit G
MCVRDSYVCQKGVLCCLIHDSYVRLLLLLLPNTSLRFHVTVFSLSQISEARSMSLQNAKYLSLFRPYNFFIFLFIILVFYEIYLNNICDCAVLCSSVVIFEMVKLMSAVNGPESHRGIPNPKDCISKHYLPGMIVHMFPVVL